MKKSYIIIIVIILLVVLGIFYRSNKKTAISPTTWSEVTSKTVNSSSTSSVNKTNTNTQSNSTNTSVPTFGSSDPNSTEVNINAADLDSAMGL